MLSRQILNVKSSTSRKPARSSSPMSASFSTILLSPFQTSFFLRAFAARMSFYRLRQFQCEVTGKSGLDYFQAVESERQEARTLHTRFPEPLKSRVLKAVQWRMAFFSLSPPRNHLLILLLKRSWAASITLSKPYMTASRIAISKMKVRSCLPSCRRQFMSISRGHR